MDFGTLIADDFATVMDQLEQITITLKRGDQGGTGTTETVTIPSANRSVMNRRFVAYQNVQLQDDDIPFSFPANEFVPVHNAPDIRPKDLITDVNGNVFIVQTAKLAVLQTVWLVVTKRKTG